MNNYLAKIRKSFPFIGRDEKKYLKNFKNSIKNENTKNLSYSEMVEQFGEPEDISKQYFEDVGMTTFKKKISFGRKIVILFACTCMLFIAFAIKSFLEGRDSYQAIKEVEIIDHGIQETE